jgi:hypothetical protein
MEQKSLGIAKAFLLSMSYRNISYYPLHLLHKTWS